MSTTYLFYSCSPFLLEACFPRPPELVHWSSVSVAETFPLLQLLSPPLWQPASLPSKPSISSSERASSKISYFQAIPKLPLWMCVKMNKFPRWCRTNKENKLDERTQETSRLAHRIERFLSSEVRGSRADDLWKRKISQVGSIASQLFRTCCFPLVPCHDSQSHWSVELVEVILSCN